MNQSHQEAKHTPAQPPAAGQAAHTPTYEVRPHYAYKNYTTGEKEREISGWDVWELTPTRHVIVSACDTREQADAEWKALTFPAHPSPIATPENKAAFAKLKPHEKVAVRSLYDNEAAAQLQVGEPYESADSGGPTRFTVVVWRGTSERFAEVFGPTKEKVLAKAGNLVRACNSHPALVAENKRLRGAAQAAFDHLESVRGRDNNPAVWSKLRALRGGRIVKP